MQNDQYLAANFWITLRIQFLFTLCGGGEKLNISKSLHEQEIYMCKSSPFYLGPSSAWHIAGAQDMGGTDQQVGKQQTINTMSESRSPAFYVCLTKAQFSTLNFSETLSNA